MAAQSDAEKYLTEKVDPVFRPLLQKLIDARPDNVRQFLLAELKKAEESNDTESMKVVKGLIATFGETG
eukprot:CAMPEP_0185747812 /NCGR_PEP_ID=MMETSP1174-20130828/6450_1 /TAXON_ID=35687 /ORGANISM="Dictyocha speculum, Strain CCMP1381" /LENGTH=68 /DNA_ID=CAMNT_0028423163 /DNA_START=36 /DNA_END=238 /DNA_ORIENTATION=+